MSTTADTMNAIMPIVVLMMLFGMMTPMVRSFSEPSSSAGGQYQALAKPKKVPIPVRVRSYRDLELDRAVPTAAGRAIAADIGRYPKSWRIAETQLTDSRADLLQILVQAGKLTADDPGMDELSVKLDLAILESLGYADVTWA